MRVDTLPGPCRDTARRLVAHNDVADVPLPEAHAVASLALRSPKAGTFELVLSVNGKQHLYSLNERQVKIIAFQAVEKITR